RAIGELSADAAQDRPIDDEKVRPQARTLPANATSLAAAKTTLLPHNLDQLLDRSDQKRDPLPRDSALEGLAYPLRGVDAPYSGGSACWAETCGHVAEIGSPLLPSRGNRDLICCKKRLEAVRGDRARGPEVAPLWGLLPGS